MNKDDVDRFEKLFVQLVGTYEEISLLSKKNPNDAVNKFKLNFINRIIKACNDFLLPKYNPFEDFKSFEDDDIPQTSDVVFILSQYIQCFEKLRADNVVRFAGFWHWQVKGDNGDDVDENGMIKILMEKPKMLRD